MRLYWLWLGGIRRYCSCRPVIHFISKKQLIWPQIDWSGISIRFSESFDIESVPTVILLRVHFSLLLILHTFVYLRWSSTGPYPPAAYLRCRCTRSNHSRQQTSQRSTTSIQNKWYSRKSVRTRNPSSTRNTNVFHYESIQSCSVYERFSRQT
jgi:hypothetical protein